MSGAVVGLDVGGTKIAGVRLSEDGEILERIRRPTPTVADEVLPAIVAAARELGADLPCGAAVPGLTDRDGVLRYGPNLAGQDHQVVAELQAAGHPAAVAVNDATAAAAGEWWSGAGRGLDDLIVLTLGTGVGGGAVVGGELLVGANGFAAEFGHLVVAADGRECACGSAGCLEAYASGSALAAHVDGRLAAGGISSLSALGRPVRGEEVTAAARAGDDLAIAVLEEAGRWLGIGLGSLVNALDPARIILAGGVATSAFAFLMPPAVAAMAQHVLGRGHRPLPDVVPASLGDDAGAVGAALLALEAFRRTGALP